MGRRKNNPDLVDELIDSRWTMDQDDFENKYDSLCTDDKCKVAKAIDGMESEWINDDEDN